MRDIKFRITGAERGAAFTVVVVPGAKRTEIVGRYGEAIKIRGCSSTGEGEGQ
jgi:hypothetical protein